MNVFHTRRHGFTLIELLVVVSLTSLLLALGMPAFSRMARGNKVEECARSIKLGLEQAQMRAAGERRYVAVIFPNGSVDDSLKPYRLGGFRCAYVTKDSSGNYSFKQWLDNGWRNAPAGAILAKTGTQGGKFRQDSDGYVTDCTNKTTSALSGVTETTSSGDSGSTTTTELFKGLSSLKDDAGNALNAGSNCTLIFTPYGGVVSGSKLYLLISEAEVNGDDISYPSAGGAGLNRTANYLVLKVNNLTGRVEYFNEE